ncbi:MAG: ATP-binding cassette domain-containing protein [Rikenellaceae bacterium]|nr:ATP-binding cassette domain-containing protein [Rikenellaceae bacterium]
MPEPVIALEGGILSETACRFAEPLHFTLGADEHIAIVGPNGSGKTTLVETLLGQRALCGGRLRYGFSGGGIRYIAFHETYNRVEDGEYYYQQRWNSCDSENAPRVGELLGRMEGDPALRDELYDLLAIRPMLDKPVIMLSSGELRKFQIVRMLLTRARVLVVDNPFIGLDAAARKLLNELLLRLAGMTGLQLILVLSSGGDIPPFVTHVYRLDDLRLGPKVPAAQLRREEIVQPPQVALPPAEGKPLECTEVVKLNRVTIRYGDRTILDSLDWTVRNGEKWALAGPNGSGKSTLLSLISADNPQAYAQDIVLFGRQRGTGESIWEIKRHIGYVSSEMHRSFLKDIPAANMVASGYFDSLGLYETPTAAQLASAEAWMEAFGIGAMAGRSFLRLSSGEQRLVLLARAFVKDPDLLILDEPLNGLDAANKERVKAIIDAFCGRPGKSLIYVSHYEADLPSCITGRLELRRIG